MRKTKYGSKRSMLFLAIISILLVSILSLILIFPKEEEKKQANIEDVYKNYCGSCHVLPSPSDIPKSIWEESVLPEMAARMGYRYNNFNPYKYSVEENYYVKLSNTYPEKPILDSVTWQRLHDYVIRMAPDSVPNTPPRKGRASELTQFNSKMLTINPNQLAGGIVNIKFDDVTGKTMIGDVYGQLHGLDKSSLTDTVFGSPIVSSMLRKDTLYLTEIGIMGPSEIPKGRILKIGPKTTTTLFEKLHRPVYSEITDLDGDGKDEIVVCEFGHHTGELSILVKKDSVYEKRRIFPLPGSIKVEVLDMDNDGKKDIVALFSQAREGIYIFYQKDDLTFSPKQVIALPPEYGLSWFSLLDYNKDGFMDIVLANGDNADYSSFLKPYHGVRLYMNNGKNEFDEKWFYPINGATRVLADDFDMDGDFDFAVMAFFPDFDNNPEEGFVYLENKEPEAFRFEPSITQKAQFGNWLVMDKGDVDQDGDVDLLLGNFNMMRSPSFRQQNSYDILYLENTAIP